MVVSESGLCKVMNRAYRAGGYRVIPTGGDGRDLMLAGYTWAVVVPMETFPRRAMGLVAVHAGCIPVESVLVRHKCPNQVMIQEDADHLVKTLRDSALGAQRAEALPLCFLAKGDSWQLFQERGRGPVRAFRASELELIQASTEEDGSPLVQDGKLGVWGGRGGRGLFGPRTLPGPRAGAVGRPGADSVGRAGRGGGLRHGGGHAGEFRPAGIPGGDRR